MLKTQYETRGPIAQDVISALACDTPILAAGEALACCRAMMQIRSEIIGVPCS